MDAVDALDPAFDSLMLAACADRFAAEALPAAASASISAKTASVTSVTSND